MTLDMFQFIAGQSYHTCQGVRNGPLDRALIIRAATTPVVATAFNGPRLGKALHPSDAFQKTGKISPDDRHDGLLVAESSFVADSSFVMLGNRYTVSITVPQNRIPH